MAQRCKPRTPWRGVYLSIWFTNRFHADRERNDPARGCSRPEPKHFLLSGGKSEPQPSIRLIGMRKFRSNPQVKIAKQSLTRFSNRSRWGMRMSAEKRGSLTAMLGEIRAGCPDAKDRLIQAIYAELVRTARE